MSKSQKPGKTSVNFVMIDDYVIPVSNTDRNHCVESGVLATRFPAASFPWVKTTSLSKYEVVVHSSADILSDLIRHLRSALPDGSELRWKASIEDPLFVFKPADVSSEFFDRNVLTPFRRYLSRYCIRSVVDSQPKAQGQLFRIEMSFDSSITNTPFFGTDSVARTSTFLYMSHMARLAISVEERGEGEDRKPMLVVSFQDKFSATDSVWNTTLIRSFPIAGIDTKSVHQTADFFLSLLASA